MSLAVAPHAVRSVVRNRDWKDSSTLFVRDLESAPRSAKVQANAAWVFLLGGEAERALAHFDRAIELGERPERFLDPYRGRAYALWELRRKEEARRAHGIFVRHGGADPRLDRVMGESSPAAPTDRPPRAPLR
jgi:tetratricopeptide (TPR) repeat protein